jgi:hypothetical protein
MSNRAFEKECIKKFGKIEGQIDVVRTEQQYMKEDITEIKGDVKDLRFKVTKACVNGAAARGETGIWIWVTRAGLIAIVGGLVTKLFALW